MSLTMEVRAARFLSIYVTNSKGNSDQISTIFFRNRQRVFVFATKFAGVTQFLFNTFLSQQVCLPTLKNLPHVKITSKNFKSI